MAGLDLEWLGRDRPGRMPYFHRYLTTPIFPTQCGNSPANYHLVADTPRKYDMGIETR